MAPLFLWDWMILGLDGPVIHINTGEVARTNGPLASKLPAAIRPPSTWFKSLDMILDWKPHGGVLE